MPTISLTLKQMRQRISASLGDLITGLAVGGSTTAMTATGELALSGGSQVQGAEISIVAGTGSVQSRRVTAHSVSSGVATLTVGSGSSTWTTTDGTSEYEIHRIGGHGYTKSEYDTAINAAIISMADGEFTDLSNVSLAMESGGASGTGRRYEYPMPSGFNYIWAVDFLRRGPVTAHRTGNLTTYRALGDAAARTRLGQGFKVGQQTLVSYIAMYMGLAASPTDNLSCVVETDSSGLPSTTAVTNGTSGTLAYSTLQARSRYVVFSFDPPMLLASATQYHLTLRRSGSTSGTNYYRVGEDGSGRYGDGALSLYDGSSWSAVSGSDLIFAVSGPEGDWIEYAPTNWRYTAASTDQLWINPLKLPVEGTPLRIRGGAVIATVSAETDSVPIDAGYCEMFAKAYLASGRAGRNLAENYNQQFSAQLQELGIVPPRHRSFPSNSVRIR